MPIQDELKLFVENFKLENGRIPTQNEIFKATGRAAKTIKSYLVEGVDYAKPLTKLEAAKLGGKKATGITKVNKNLIKEFNELKIKGIYPSIETSRAGSKAFRLKFDKKLGLQEIGGPANKETLDKIKTTVSEVIESDNYTKNILPFQTSDEKRKYRAFKRAEYKIQDPRNIYKQLQDYKRKKYPNVSFDENIQHGQSKFSTQTLSRFGLLPRQDNVEGPIKAVERIRDNNLKTTLATLKNPKASVAAKKAAAEKYNNIVKGLRGQLKGTEVQGFVNFETFEVDEKGNFKKIKDIGFNPKKGMAYNNILGNKSLAELTDAEADEILKIGKKHIDLQLLPKTVSGLTTASKIDRPEKALLKEDFKAFSSRIKNYDNLDPTTYPSKTYVRNELKKVPVEAPVNQAIKDFDIPKGTILKGLAKGTLRAVAPFVPFVGAVGVALGVSDVAKAKDEGLEGEELGIAYLVGPELAKKYSDFKDRNLNVETESEGIMGLKDGGRVGFFKGAVAGGENISPGTDVGGNVRDDNPFTGGGDDKPTDIPPPPKDGTIPITVNLGTDNVLGFNVPKFVDLGLPTQYGLLNLRQNFSDFINPDEIDINPELTFGGSTPLFGGNLQYGVGMTKEGFMSDPSPFITFSKTLNADKFRR